ncbi:MAG: hypothetical protein A3I00_01445 [Betaproteobacteria bacterium RIFCSPLOWO2_02_FULL_64_12]|nr:MAG: hypothetical protein A3I00_01445 [Betaproteobacteria bacterium RIFCSPLOWO2_02_FULL_64_12]
MTYAIKIFTTIVFQSAVVFLFAGSVIAIAYGAMLFFRKEWALKVNERLNRWTSTRQMMRRMEAPRNVEPQLQRWHQFAGVFLLIASAYVFYAVIVSYSPKAIAAAYYSKAPTWVVEIVLAALWWVIALGSVGGCILALILIFRPPVLRRLEAWANRSFSVRHATKFLEVMNHAPDQLIALYPKVSSAVIVLGSLYVALMLGGVLLYPF